MAGHEDAHLETLRSLPAPFPPLLPFPSPACVFQCFAPGREGRGGRAGTLPVSCGRRLRLYLLGGACSGGGQVCVLPGAAAVLCPGGKVCLPATLLSHSCPGPSPPHWEVLGGAEPPFQGRSSFSEAGLPPTRPKECHSQTFMSQCTRKPFLKKGQRLADKLGSLFVPEAQCASAPLIPIVLCRDLEEESTHPLQVLVIPSLGEFAGGFMAPEY